MRRFRQGFVLAAIGPGDREEGIEAMRAYIRENGFDAELVRIRTPKDTGEARVEAKVDIYWPAGGRPRRADDGEG